MRPMTLREKSVAVLSGMALSLLLLEGILRISGFAASFSQERRNRLSLRTKGEYRILCLGESPTAWGGNDSYSAQLERMLNARNPGIKISVINGGKSGANSTVAAAVLPVYLDNYSPQAVVTMLGVNDGSDEFVLAREGGTDIISNPFFGKSRVIKLAQLLIARIRHKLFPLPDVAVVRQVEELCFPFSYGPKAFLLEELRLKNPAAYQSFIEFKTFFATEAFGERRTAERLLAAINARPENPWGYLALGRYYWFEGCTPKAEAWFGSAIEKAQKNEWIYLAIAYCYMVTRNFDKYEELFIKAIEANPNNPLGYVGLGWCYDRKRQPLKAAALFDKALQIDPRNANTHCLLGDVYRDQKKLKDAEEAFKKAIQCAPSSAEAYIKLTFCYQEQGKCAQAREIAQQGISACGQNERLFALLALLCAQAGEEDAAQEYSRKTMRLRLSYRNPITQKSYRKIQQLLVARNIRFVCMQYPLRSLESLVNLFDQTDGIIFVDNEKIFKEALRKGKYSDYFKDAFAGDFGHCTAQGNRLIAENLSRVIMDALLNREGASKGKKSRIN